MKPNPRIHLHTLSTLAAFVVCVTGLHAGSINTTFSFQQGDLRQDGTLFGSGDTYAGVVDGHITDNTATSARTTGVTATLGNQFRSGSPNGQQLCGLFSYDLSELNTFIAANTSSSSSVTVTSVSFKVISASAASGSAMTLNLYGTDPFTAAGCTWSNFTTATPWTTPYQNIVNNTVAYGFTGGPTALTSSLGGTNPTTGTAGAGGTPAGTTLTWGSSFNFISAISDSLARPDKTLYLTARGSFFSNSDNRVNIHTSPATTVDNRPELLISLAINTFSDWTGASNASWATAGNWTNAPATGDNVRFNASSTANLNTVLDQDFSLNGIALVDPTGPVSIGGTNILTLGAGGLDLSAATQDLSITAPLVLGAAQNWNLAASRTLSVSSAVTGTGDLTIVGAGGVTLGAANMLPNGASAGNLNVSGNLDLNGFTQSVNALTGNGIVDNKGAGAVVLTIGNNDASGSFTGTLQDTGGALSVVKTGTGALTLTGANDFSGGFTNNGSGNVTPNNSLAFGTGPVVSNAGTLYATATTTFANALTLNSSNLRIGGGNNRLLTWSGPVSVTANSSLLSDGGTAGVTVSGDVTLSSGATLSSAAGGTAHTISGAIGGTGSLTVSSGTLILNGVGSYNGPTLMNAGTLRLDPNGTIPDASDLTINGTGNFVVRNTVSWVYDGVISGDGTGQINLNTGTNATLAGDISGVVNINANNAGTDLTISGDISGATNVTVQSGVDGSGVGAILRLGGANSYTGTTTVNRGSLVLAASNVLPDLTPVAIGNATLDAATHTDIAGTLDPTSTATIHLGAGATLAFADSSAVDWTDGTLTITGTFVPGNLGSLRFGTNSAGLTDDQLLKITADGFTGFDLDANGYLTATAAGSPYDTWKAQITNGQDLRTDDADGDGFNNLQEFLLGTSPIAGNGSLVTTTTGSGNLTLRWLQRETGATYVLQQSTTLGIGSWSPVVSPTPAMDGDQTGVPTDYDRYTVTLPTGGGSLFFRVEGVEN